jgi:hypothetical protein
MFDLKIDGTQVSYTLLPLGTPGVYYYTITATNNKVNSIAVQTNTVTINTILAPSSVYIRNNEDYFICSWLGGIGLTYNIQFYNQTTQEPTLITSQEGLFIAYFGYTVPSLNAGSSYYFVITSVAGDGRTSASVKSETINI